MQTPDARSARVAAIGGGHGLARTLEALLDLKIVPDAIVTVADDGGSSGRLRSEHQVMALGDMRMALHTMAPPGVLRDVFGHRFGGGQLDGHAAGNLMMLALLEQHEWDVEGAVAATAEMLQCRGRVHPCTSEDVVLSAQIDGSTVRGQVAVGTTPGTLQQIWIEPADARGFPPAVAAIRAADLVLLGPGSLYTSLIPNLLVADVAAAVIDTSAPVVYLANLTTQPGETVGMDLQDHVEALLQHLPGEKAITVVAHDGPELQGDGESLAPTVSHRRVDRVVLADLASRGSSGLPIAAHDAHRLALAIDSVLLRSRTG